MSNVERRLGTRMTAIGGLALGLTCLLPAWNRTLVPKSVLAELHFRWNAPVFLSEFEQWARMREQCDEWRTLGRALRHVSRPTDSFVYGAVGAVGYESMLMIYDRNGLVTREVALLERPQGRRSPGHAKTVPKEFFLPMRPTWLDAFLLPSGKAPPPHFDLSTWRVFDLPTELGVEPGTKLFAQPGDA